MKDETFQKLLFPMCASFILLIQFGLIPLPHLNNALRILQNPTAQYDVIQHPYWRLLASIMLCLLGIVGGKFCDRTIALVKITIVGSLFSIIGVFLFDLIVITTKAMHGLLTFDSGIQSYFSEEWNLFLVSLLVTAFYCFLIFRFRSEIKKDHQKNAKQKQVMFAIFIAIAAILPLIIPLPIQIANYQVFSSQQNSVPLGVAFMINTIYAICAVSLLVAAVKKRNDNTLTAQELIKISMATAIGAALTFAIIFVLLFSSFKWLAIGARFSYRFKMLSSYMSANLFAQLPIVITIFAGVISRTYWKKKQFDVKSGVDKTTGSFGTSSWATKSYLKEIGAYDTFGSLFGKDDEGQLLRCVTKNRTIIAAPGGGKGAGIVVPALLTEDRPVFVNDIKGELWAVTARHRAYGFGRKRRVIAIDPFRILQQPEYSGNKPKDLMEIYTINPFDYISKEETQRDRDINALVSSLVVREGEHNSHWDDNAEILLKGLIDFMIKMSNENEVNNLLRLHNYMMKDLEKMRLFLDVMLTKGGSAQAAAAQILKTAPEERGSIYSTTYRQLKWLVDSNMQRTFKESNFDLRDFLKGDMDIFVVIPEDQVVFHQRVFRMIFTLITSILSQAPLSELPRKDILFILDELGQFGYCKDVERAIEILRVRKAVVWSVFQSYGQIKLYKKPDLFTNAHIKQIFDVDDEETMRWIQTLGGKKTILTKALSTQTGDSRHKMQAFGGNVSKGDGENVHETGVDLIHINEIRELARDDQFVFIRGCKAIKCKRLVYFTDERFLSKADPNPFY